MSDSYNDYLTRGWTRHEAFEDILHRFPPRKEYRPGDLIVLNVRFNYGGPTYCYLSEDDVYKPGDLVEVMVGGTIKVVEVDSVGYYSEEEFPYKAVKINTVRGPASGDLAEKYREAIASEEERSGNLEKIRAEAAAMLEEAWQMKTASEEELRQANELHDEAEKQLTEARRIKAEADAAQEAVIRSTEQLVETALSGLESRIAKVKKKANELLEDEGTSEHIRDLIDKLHNRYLPETESLIEEYRHIFRSDRGDDALR